MRAEWLGLVCLLVVVCTLTPMATATAEQQGGWVEPVYTDGVSSLT